MSLNPFYFSIIILLLGIFTRYFTGNEPNWIGYKSSFSIKNSELWKLANSTIGNWLILLGIISIILSFFFTIKTIALINLFTGVGFAISLEFHLYKKYTSH